MTNTNTTEAQLSSEEREMLIKLSEQRMATYHLLARLFRTEIDEELLEELKAMRFPVSTGNAKVDEGLSQDSSYLSNTWEQCN